MLSRSCLLSKMNKNGTLRILYCEEIFGLASTFTLPTLTLPFDSLANWSMIGATDLQLGHQDAQANIKAGSGEFSILSSKLLSVTIMGCGANSSPTGRDSPHLPHLAPSST